MEGKRPLNDDSSEYLPVVKKLNTLHLDVSSNENSSSSDAYEMLPEYLPSLNKTQNPHYYDMNRCLFEAHHLRLLRKNDPNHLGTR